MSRIHDALKKAEQERIEGVPPNGAVQAPEDSGPAGSQYDVSPTVTQSKATPARPGGDGSHGAVELHRLLLERCLQYSWNPDRRMMLLFDRRSPTAGLEEFRTLRSHLDLIRQKRPLQKLLITSALPREGKTLVSMNLAQVIARQRERRVLLIDADMREPRMHLWLGTPSAPGLSDYLAGDVDEFGAIQRGQLENLFFVPAGKAVSNPSELIANGRLRLVLQRLAPAFDWIILDSPPVLPVSDAKLLAESCDGVLVVIQAGSTPSDLAQKACQEFRDKRLLGVVLNRVKPGHGYNSYYYYGNKAKTKAKGEAAIKRGSKQRSVY